MAPPPTVTFCGMNVSEIYEQLTAIFPQAFDEDSIEAMPILSAKDLDGEDSLSHIRLVITIARAFKINFFIPEIGGRQKAGDLVALIEKRV